MYIKLLEVFILKILFNKNEYDLKSKQFNPLRFFIISILVSNLMLTFYLFNTLNKLYYIIQAKCPDILIEKKDSNIDNTKLKKKITKSL